MWSPGIIVLRRLSLSACAGRGRTAPDRRLTCVFCFPLSPCNLALAIILAQTGHVEAYLRLTRLTYRTAYRPASIASRASETETVGFSLQLLAAAASAFCLRIRCRIDSPACSSASRAARPRRPNPKTTPTATAANQGLVPSHSSSSWSSKSPSSSSPPPPPPPCIFMSPPRRPEPALELPPNVGGRPGHGDDPRKSMHGAERRGWAGWARRIEGACGAIMRPSAPMLQHENVTIATHSAVGRCMLRWRRPQSGRGDLSLFSRG